MVHHSNRRTISFFKLIMNFKFPYSVYLFFIFQEIDLGASSVAMKVSLHFLLLSTWYLLNWNSPDKIAHFSFVAKTKIQLWLQEEEWRH